MKDTSKTYQRDFFNRLYSSQDRADQLEYLYRAARSDLVHKYSKCKGLILDVGAGECEISFPISKKAKVIAIDIASAGLSKAKYRGFKGSLIAGDGYNLPFRKEIFDTIICIEVIEHVSFPRIFIESILRVLKQKARLIITTPNGGRIIRRVARLLGWVIEFSHTHLHEFSLKELVGIFRKEKLKIINVTGFAIDIPSPFLRIMPNSIIRILLTWTKRKLPLFFFKLIGLILEKI